MTVVLKATQEQYEALEGYRAGVSVIRFTKDSNGDWITSAENRDNPAFWEIAESLAGLEEVEFVAGEGEAA